MSEQQNPTDRLSYTGDLEPLAERVCEAYDIGHLERTEVVEVGIEDCNVIVATDQGKFLAKMFAKTRSPADIERYISIIQKAIEAGVHHPKIIPATGGMSTYSEEDITLILMRFVEGKTFLQLDRSPNSEERKAVLEEAAKINRIDYHPAYAFDIWAVPNIRAMYQLVKQYIEADDLRLVEQAMEQFEAIQLDELPHCFVHGDFTKANVIKAECDEVYILDFSVANWYPRIQELAVIAANLLHDDNSQHSLRETCTIVGSEYSEYNSLVYFESQHIYPYALAALAMDFMGSHQEKYILGHDNAEIDYWLNLGRTGLRNATR